MLMEGDEPRGYQRLLSLRASVSLSLGVRSIAPSHPVPTQHCRSRQVAVAGGGPGELHFSGAMMVPV